jgi:hypothetical protein
MWKFPWEMWYSLQKFVHPAQKEAVSCVMLDTCCGTLLAKSLLARNGPGYLLNGELRCDQSAQKSSKQIAERLIRKVSVHFVARMDAPPIDSMMTPNTILVALFGVTSVIFIVNSSRKRYYERLEIAQCAITVPKQEERVAMRP